MMAFLRNSEMFFLQYHNLNNKYYKIVNSICTNICFFWVSIFVGFLRFPTVHQEARTTVGPGCHHRPNSNPYSWLRNHMPTRNRVAF